MFLPLLWHLMVFLPLVHAAEVHVVNKPQVQVTTTFSGFDARIMDQWGDGGGSASKISDKFYHPFSTREFGGGRRSSIRGTNMFGSGYPFGEWRTSSIAGRNFPFGVWPLYWGNNFLDSDEVGPQLDNIRPGGHVSIVPLRTTGAHTDDEVYYAIGDSQSLLAVLTSYVTGCRVDVAWPTTFDPASPNVTVKVENVLQYYRASSFALASPSFTNPHARNFTYGMTYPIPDDTANSTLWKCLDSTTASSLPIMNPPPTSSPLKLVLSILLSSLWIVVPLAVYILVLLGQLCFWARDWICNYEENMTVRREARRNEMEKRDIQFFGYERFP